MSDVYLPRTCRIPECPLDEGQRNIAQLAAFARAKESSTLPAVEQCQDEDVPEDPPPWEWVSIVSTKKE